MRREILSVCFGNGGYPDRWPRHQRCPVCDQAALSPTFQKYGFTHDQCASCGVIVLNPYPPAEIMAKLYDGEYYTFVRKLFELPRLLDEGQATPFTAPEDALVSVIETACAGRDQGGWLDIGGGLGAFANLVRRRKPNWRVRLNEANRRSAQIAREVFDLEVLAQDLSELKNQNASFDVVSTISVLEHITHPFEFLQGCLDILAPGGRLVTIVPHFTRLNAQISWGSSPNAAPPYHVSLFSERALTTLIGRLPAIRSSSVEQYGRAAFKLIHHVQIGDNWDISIPTEDNPTPKSVLVTPYTPEQRAAISALAKADVELVEYFAKTDGRLFLASLAWKDG